MDPSELEHYYIRIYKRKGYDMLDFRMKNILRELMSTPKPLTGSFLANMNHVTVRTTRNDIKNLDSILKNYGASITSIMGTGYKLEITQTRKFLQFLQSLTDNPFFRKDEIPKTPVERVTYMIRRILLNESYIKLDDLADEMYISKSTIQNDLKAVKEILTRYDLTLESKPNYGLKAIGNEVKLRFCMAEYVFERNEQSEKRLYETTLPFLSQDELNHILDSILRHLKNHQSTLPDIAINNLLVHIAIAYKRIKDGHSITLYKTDLQELVSQKEYQVAQEIVKEVEQFFQVTFPEEEIAYITIHLLGTKILKKTNEKVEQMMDEDILATVEYILDQVEKKFNLGIKEDKELILGLCLHLKPAINRYKYGMNIRNPTLQEIKKNYPLAFDAGVAASLAIEILTGTVFEENEVGYIALHIGAAIERKKMKSQAKRCLVVCASGLGTAQLIYYRLKSYFGNNLDVIGTTEFYQLKTMNLDNVDFLVSSIPITKEIGIPVIEVNAIIGESDLKKINRFISEQSLVLNNYFRNDLVFLRKRLASKEEVLTYLNRILLHKGLVNDTFLDAVYEREKVAPTSFGNLVAIPHPINSKTKQTFLTVCTLEKPVYWEKKPVQLVFLLSVKQYSQEDLQEMYELLVKIVQDPDIVQHLLKAKTIAEFMDVIQEEAL